jgi:hypothetical protein
MIDGRVLFCSVLFPQMERNRNSRDGIGRLRF